MSGPYKRDTFKSYEVAKPKVIPPHFAMGRIIAGFYMDALNARMKGPDELETWISDREIEAAAGMLIPGEAVGACIAFCPEITDRIQACAGPDLGHAALVAEYNEPKALAA